MISVGLECTAVFQYERGYQGLTAFYHNDEGITAFLHVPDVILAEISPIEYETHLL